MTGVVEVLRRLDDEWNIGAPEHHLEGASLGTVGGAKVVFALDPQGGRHLLIATTSRAGLAPHRWNGLTASINEWSIAGHDASLWVDIRCAGVGYERVFRALCSDIIRELPRRAVPVTEAVSSVLGQWADFWRRNVEFSREAEIGLIGELLFLRDWVMPHHGDSSIAFWTGPTGTTHDFTSSSISIEVKTTSGTQSAPAHTISSLEQLDDPSSGVLYLASIQIMEDPIGELGVTGLIKDVVMNLGSGDIGLFETLLARLRVPDESSLPTTRWRLMSTGLYSVSESFPRMTWSKLPQINRAAIPNASYRLEMAACSPWLEEDRPSERSVLRAMQH